MKDYKKDNNTKEVNVRSIKPVIKKLRIDDLRTVSPITQHQRDASDAFKSGDHLALVGTAGTGKTFMALYFALEEVMDKSTQYDQVKIIRSVVPTRDVGFLPGTLEEKLDAFTGPYRSACSVLFDDNKAWENLIENGVISFDSTSFIRGMTYDNSIIIVDECQNCSFHELDSIITRVGEGTRIIFCGDYHQSDFKNDKDKQGINQFLGILEQMKSFTTVTFTWEDIVRSDFVRDYIMTKEHIGIR
jgi:predicted ribonuclease YlaK